MKEKNIEYPQGIKWTKQRKAVYSILTEEGEPLSAAQIYSRMLKNADKAEYAISTVYRILSVFEEKGYVERSHFLDDGTVVYQWKKDGHTHYAHCLGCHKRVALASCPFEHLHLDTEMNDFEIMGHKLELYGYCRDCQKTGKIPEICP